ncbi:aspartate/glutamate racemase family protein [Amaricoccus solimangrovi]|uniref:Hydantoin racemase n=1 Tax=Amaricoccus solimangrovi TaxID=2589815 RepID=A0A501WQI4_9RHOB|nr:aspartate/glutamate racemase family protein [Amaricoccus solimangrovi]TPE48046.1 aspartate/glutamate racemase family protein [Amaricoccus solimangrovi]
MKIKVINPNTTWTMTEKIGAAARAVAAPETEIVAVSPTMGPASIEGFYDEAFAAVGVIDEVRKGEAEGCDGYVIACFGDPGLAAAREIASGPVVGIAESAMHAASLIGTGFSIVSMLERGRASMEHLVHAYGMHGRCRSIRMTDIPVLDLEEEGSDAQALVIAACRAAIEEDHADCVLLGCGGMSDLMKKVTAEIGAPAIDGVSAGVKLVEALVGLGLGTSKRHGYARPLPKEYVGAFSDYALK